MRSAKKWIGYIQVVASLSLGLSYFLPFYLSQAFGTETVKYAGNVWELFFWSIPASLIFLGVSRRWLRIAFSVLSIAGGMLTFTLVTFIGTYKHPPLIGFYVARTSITILILSWFILGMISLFTPQKDKEAKK